MPPAGPLDDEPGALPAADDAAEAEASAAGCVPRHRGQRVTPVQWAAIACGTAPPDKTTHSAPAWSGGRARRASLAVAAKSASRATAKSWSRRTNRPARLQARGTAGAPKENPQDQTCTQHHETLVSTLQKSTRGSGQPTVAAAQGDVPDHGGVADGERDASCSSGGSSLEGGLEDATVRGAQGEFQSWACLARLCKK